jgi:hypothetical protein
MTQVSPPRLHQTLIEELLGAPITVTMEGIILTWNAMAETLFGDTGIGLAICRKIVERRGGIRIELVLGQAAVFHVSLPPVRTAPPGDGR